MDYYYLNKNVDSMSRDELLVALKRCIEEEAGYLRNKIEEKI
jgi:hypothetical protein